MKIVLFIVSILLITLVLLQAGKADNAGGMMTGATEGLFTNRKERGAEVFITRATFVLGAVFFVICFAMGF